MVFTVHLGNIEDLNSREGSGAIVGLKGRNLEGVVLRRREGRGGARGSEWIGMNY